MMTVIERLFRRRLQLIVSSLPMGEHWKIIGETGITLNLSN